MEYYSLTKENGMLIHATMWISLDNMMLSGEAKHKDYLLSIPFI